MGSLTSAPLRFVGGIPSMNVRTWWEVESVNPRAADLLRIQITTDGGTTWTTLKQLNPSSNPERGAPGIAYSSGGFNQPGRWVWSGPIDLEPYANRDVQLRFVFDSVTAGHNSFEGWYIDDVTFTTVSIFPGPVETAGPAGYRLHFPLVEQ